MKYLSARCDRKRTFVPAPQKGALTSFPQTERRNQTLRPSIRIEFRVATEIAARSSSGTANWGALFGEIGRDEVLIACSMRCLLHQDRSSIRQSIRPKIAFHPMPTAR